MIVLFKLFFLDYFGRPNHLGVDRLDFANDPESSPSDLFDDLIIGQIIAMFHFGERVPPYLDFFNVRE